MYSSHPRYDHDRAPRRGRSRERTLIRTRSRSRSHSRSRSPGHSRSRVTERDYEAGVVYVHERRRDYRSRSRSRSRSPRDRRRRRHRHRRRYSPSRSRSRSPRDRKRRRDAYRTPSPPPSRPRLPVTPVGVSQRRIKDTERSVLRAFQDVYKVAAVGEEPASPLKRMAFGGLARVAEMRERHSLRYYGGIDHGHAQRVALLRMAGHEAEKYLEGETPPGWRFEASVLVLSSCTAPRSPAKIPAPRTYPAPRALSWVVTEHGVDDGGDPTTAS